MVRVFFVSAEMKPIKGLYQLYRWRMSEMGTTEGGEFLKCGVSVSWQ
jgi:hypothetical protein